MVAFSRETACGWICRRQKMDVFVSGVRRGGLELSFASRPSYRHWRYGKILSARVCDGNGLEILSISVVLPAIAVVIARCPSKLSTWKLMGNVLCRVGHSMAPAHRHSSGRSLVLSLFCLQIISLQVTSGKWAPARPPRRNGWRSIDGGASRVRRAKSVRVGGGCCLRRRLINTESPRTRWGVALCSRLCRGACVRAAAPPSRLWLVVVRRAQSATPTWSPSPFAASSCC